MLSTQHRVATPDGAKQRNATQTNATFSSAPRNPNHRECSTRIPKLGVAQLSPARLSAAHHTTTDHTTTPCSNATQHDTPTMPRTWHHNTPSHSTATSNVNVAGKNVSSLTRNIKQLYVMPYNASSTNNIIKTTAGENPHRVKLQTINANMASSVQRRVEIKKHYQRITRHAPTLRAPKHNANNTDPKAPYVSNPKHI